ncbi:hypothetical protein Deipr_1481 [Deinococcus proteolyticus MRP]|uniref:Protein kinase domain-containing protein n=1 Tax=Deinococcus proteolyticus (strain ATCC 35074 / DSM 20540 / JCM 6276 / NBRC 101906 / NCIMB 13154 / VKM Ac-1939 / CCM 2703 / MRP) TaxID=693977 RepID=F0RJX5_DEIPM|nr:MULTISPECIES: hypothetical protein [Deinococcus]ADY26621.1 hypothetical protein Deipr_1481 [Deinococcus proteolyticus MRP]MCY1702746.1 hypothetical protein [Deinococcus sp. SL84]
MTATSYIDGHGQPVALSTELGRGGEGAVFTVDGRPDVVAKIYLKIPEQAQIEKIRSLPQLDDPSLQAISAWAQTTLSDEQGRIRGFLMPKLGAGFEESHLLYRRLSRRQHFPRADWRFLVHVARNVTRSFAVLHRHGILMGDVSSRNVSVNSNGIVRLTDTDSYQINWQGNIYPCPVGTAEFTPPELQGKGFGSLVRTKDHDLFGLAVLIFHLLFDGRHPYSGIHSNGAMPSPAEAIKADQFAYSLQRKNGVKPPAFMTTLESLHPDLARLFERAFSPRQQGRPAAEEWEAALATLSANIVTCSKNADHKYDRRLTCPWCAIENIRAATAKTGFPAGAQRIDVEGALNRIWQGLSNIPVPAAPQMLQVPQVNALPLPPAPPATSPPPMPAMPPLQSPPPIPTLPPVDAAAFASLPAPQAPAAPTVPQVQLTDVRQNVAAPLAIFGTLCLVSLLSKNYFLLLIFAFGVYYNLSRNSPQQLEMRRQQRQKVLNTLHEEAIRTYEQERRQYETALERYQQELKTYDQRRPLLIAEAEQRREEQLQQLIQEREQRIAQMEQERSAKYAALLEDREKQIKLSEKKHRREYALLLRQALVEHEQTAQQLREQINGLYLRLLADCAETGYEQAMDWLKEMRVKVRNFDAEERNRFNEVTGQYRQKALENFLANNVLKPGDVPGIGPTVIANLNSYGFVTAKDLDYSVQHVRGIGPKKLQDLLLWRDSVEQFFQFDISQVPSPILAKVRDEMNRERQRVLDAMEGVVAKLPADIQTWKAAEQATLQSLLQLQTQLAQREKTISMIQQWQV